MLTLRLICFAVLCIGTAAPCAAAQQYDFPVSAVDDPASLAKAMPVLAMALIATYKESDPRTYLDNLFRLQIVAGQYADATRTLSTLRSLRGTDSPRAPATNVQYEIFAKAKLMEGEDGLLFDEAFKRSFREVVGKLDDRIAGIVAWEFGASLSSRRADLRSALSGQREKSRISLADALTLVRNYQVEETYRSFQPLAASLVAEDDRRRYIIENDLQIKTSDGAAVCAFIVRPRSATERLPALLQYTIYADRTQIMTEERRTASNGYVAVEALTRGKGCSPDEPVPYEHDGEDAANVIDWVSRQPWSDGRVGMYGGSYNSFAQWAAAKHLPRALKAMMVGVPNAPGIDTPMERNVFQSFSYEWPLYTTTGKWLDATSEGDQTRWIDLEKKWYASGSSYRSMDKIDGTPNPIFDRWLDHPSYDAYWQSLIPYKHEFARISIPVLITDGYLGGQDTGGLYYFSQYQKYNPQAEKYLLIGPYDHLRGQFGTGTILGDEYNIIGGYKIDPAAHLDMLDLRYGWFNYIFKGAPKPAILKDKVNYEVMGANEWKHAPAIDAMHNQRLRFHLSAARSGELYRLAERKPARNAYIEQTVNFADRSDVNRIPSAAGLDTYLGIAFESAPFKKPFDLSGLFSGRLDFITNKKDLDFDISLYELTPKGDYIGITYYMARASYVSDRSRRHLLRPGKHTRLDFASSRLTSWKIPAGSRLVLLLSIVKEPDIQINYGTGKDVSDETIADATTPLTVEWFDDSFVDIPVWR